MFYIFYIKYGNKKKKTLSLNSQVQHLNGRNNNNS